jgi:serine/threonine protein phosphatase 1
LETQLPIRVDRQAFALPRAAADGVEIFAIGDVHGRSDLLAALLEAAAREPRRAKRRVIVFLGDLIDRGPDSLGTIDLAINAARLAAGDETIALMGNHETMMRLAVDRATPHSGAINALEIWLLNGGAFTIAEIVRGSEPPADLAGLLQRLRDDLPARVETWLPGLKPHWRSGDLLFVHAGVNPSVELETFLAAPWNTPLEDLEGSRHWAWVRWPFIDADPGPNGFGGAFVVHGHTPADLTPGASHADQIRRFRLNLDAGSVKTGVVEMAILRGASAEVVSAHGPAGHGPL